jgi:predicted esterase
MREIAHEANAQTRILICHGYRDAVVLFSLGEETARVLQEQLTNPVDFKGYSDLGHSSSDQVHTRTTTPWPASNSYSVQEMRDVLSFLNSALRVEHS